MQLHDRLRLERHFRKSGIVVHLVSQFDGLIVEGEDLADRLIAVKELREMGFRVPCHVERVITPEDEW